MISGVVNVLALTSPLFMLQVYDRVLASHSVPTLVGIAVLAAGLYAFQCLRLSQASFNNSQFIRSAE
ncbi:hypothetical protein A9K72_30520 [Mesorhizobium loti]|uniref:Probable toxin secretion ABC transporter n=1 Tax=Rhizobium loti TaxID=381 RepID=M5B2H8_RHILI|nr:hypothetical protein A9K72_30520 [Mesorhizobium loti]BAN09591.1 probable toxin secretion ABC transporter [Mesorhizobium loti NZP2037]